MQNKIIISNGEIIKELDEKRIKDINKLLSLCNVFDGTSIDIILTNRDKENIIDNLYYYNGELLGYLYIYLSYKNNEAFIIGMVHPLYRNQGIFSFLLESAKEFLIEQGRSKINFIVDNNSSSGKDYLSSLQAKYRNSTYQMEFVKETNLDKKNINNHVFIVKPNIDDVSQLVKIGMDAFDTTEDEERQLALNNIKDPNRILLAAKYDEILVGIVASIKNEKKAIIGDLGVLKEYRNKGIGKTLLIKSINYLNEEGIDNISLSVDAFNDNALKLYEKCGFVTIKANDFYQLNIN